MTIAVVIVLIAASIVGSGLVAVTRILTSALSMDVNNE